MLFTISNATKVGKRNIKIWFLIQLQRTFSISKNLSACLHLTALKNKKR